MLLVDSEIAATIRSGREDMRCWKGHETDEVEGQLVFCPAHDPELEIARLREAVVSAIHDLRQHGCHGRADQLEAALSEGK